MMKKYFAFFDNVEYLYIFIIKSSNFQNPKIMINIKYNNPCCPDQAKICNN